MIDTLFLSWVLLFEGGDSCCKGIGLKIVWEEGGQDVGMEGREVDANRCGEGGIRLGDVKR